MAKQQAQPVFFKLVDSGLSIDSTYLLKLYDENAENEDGDRDILRYSKNHKNSAWVDKQDTDKFKAVTGFAKFVGDYFDDALAYKADSKNKALLEFFRNSSNNVDNGGGLFYEFNKQKEAEAEFELFEAEEKTRESIKELTIAELESINVFLGDAYVKARSLKEAKMDVIRHFNIDNQAVQKAIDSKEREPLFIAHKATSYGKLTSDGKSVKFGGKQIADIPIGNDQFEILSKKFQTNEELFKEVKASVAKSK